MTEVQQRSFPRIGHGILVAPLLTTALVIVLGLVKPVSGNAPSYFLPHVDHEMPLTLLFALSVGKRMLAAARWQCGWDGQRQNSVTASPAAMSRDALAAPRSVISDSIDSALRRAHDRRRAVIHIIPP